MRTIDFGLVDEWGLVVDESTDGDPQSCAQGCGKVRSWSVLQTFLQDGVYTLRTTATDQLGNVATDERTVHIVRGIPPTIR